jgi:hypothetical protein
VCGGVAEPGGNVAEEELRARGGNVVGDAQRAIATGDDGRLVAVDAAREPAAQFQRIAGGDDMKVGAQRLGGEADRAPDAIGSRAAGPLVEEDGRAGGAYGSASRISATSASLPVRK